jgi:hypothetical protein
MLPVSSSIGVRTHRPKQKTSVILTDERSFISFQTADYVLMCLRLAFRALALAGRLPWFAFLSFFPDLAISIFLFA